MERLRRAVQGRSGVLGLGLLGLVLMRANDARAQSPDASAQGSSAELVAARELFRQGTADADAGHFADGLAKFRRVAAVKETAAVRFNIARCEEALGKTGAALGDFELAEREAAQDPKAGTEDVGQLAHARADALRGKVPRLTLEAPLASPDGMTVSLDGAKLATATLGVALPVDPGRHVIDASAPAAAPFHAEISLAPGEAQRVSIALAPASTSPADAPPATTSSTPRTWGWLAIGLGAALGGGSLALLVAHNGAVSTVNADCPAQRCPASEESSVNGTESTARTEEAISVALVAASALAVGGGIVLLVTSPHESTRMTVTTGAAGAPAGLTLRGSF